MKQEQDCAKISEKQMITQLIEQGVKNILEFLEKKEDMCADMFEGHLLKNKSVKRSQKQNGRKNVNVEGVVSLTLDQIRYLAKRNAKKWEHF